MDIGDVGLSDSIIDRRFDEKPVLWPWSDFRHPKRADYGPQQYVQGETPPPELDFDRESLLNAIKEQVANPNYTELDNTTPREPFLEYLGRAISQIPRAFKIPRQY